MTDDLRRIEAKVDEALELLRELISTTGAAVERASREPCRSCGGYEPDGHYESCKAAREWSRGMRRAAGGAA